MLDLLNSHLFGGKNPEESVSKELGASPVSGSIEVKDLSGEAAKNTEAADSDAATDTAAGARGNAQEWQPLRCSSGGAQLHT